MPIDDLADSGFGLLIREVDDLSAAPGRPALGAGQHLSACCSPTAARSGSTRWSAASGRAGADSRSGTSSGTGACTARGGSGCSAGRRRWTRIRRRSSAPSGRLFEREADAFAAALLMPARLMEREYRQDRDFYSLCERFQVSAKAMSRRLRAVI